MRPDAAEHLPERAVRIFRNQLDRIHVMGHTARHPLRGAGAAGDAADTARERLRQHRHRHQQLGIDVMEDVDLAADLVDLVDVVSGPLELRLDEWTPQVHGETRRFRSQIVGRLLESAHADRGPECRPAGHERLLGRQRLEQERHPADAHLACHQLVDLDRLPIGLRLVHHGQPVDRLAACLACHPYPQPPN